MLALLGNPDAARHIYDSSDETDDSANDFKPHPSISHETIVQLNEMRERNQLCDAVIKTDKGETFQVHRVVIGSCSDYFR